MSEVQSPSEVEVKARQLGWVPKEDFRGGEERWVDAETFVKRGEEIMPLLKQNNKVLQDKLEKAEAEQRRQAGIIAASQEALEELKIHQAESTKRQVEKAKKELYAQLKAAKKEGDVDLEVDLQEQISEMDKELGKAAEPPKKKTEAPAPAPQPADDPVFTQWRQDNPWFDADPVRQSTAIGVASKMRKDPANSALVGRPFFDAVAAEVAAIFDRPRGGPPKVEPGGGSGGGSGGERKRTFNDLPADAKAVCKQQTPKLVGEGRAFKTEAEWHAHYVKDYFGDEE